MSWWWVSVMPSSVIYCSASFRTAGHALGCWTSGDCGARPRVLDERSVTLDLDDGGCPSLAALVADIDTWRGRAQVPEATLRLGGETRILRTEG